MKTFMHPQEVWDAKECLRRSKVRHRDGCGTVHPRPGLIASSGSTVPQYGQTIRYNGGCVRNEEWFEAEAIPLPAIAPGFAFSAVPTWGVYLVKL